MPQHLRKVAYVGDVTCVVAATVPPHGRRCILWGSGPYLRASDTDTGELVLQEAVFDGARVHGLRCGASATHACCTVVAFGDRFAKVFALSQHAATGAVVLRLRSALPAQPHWLLDAALLPAAQAVAIGMSNNSVALWSAESAEGQRLASACCTERCMLYSMAILPTDSSISVAAGTVFNDVLVWQSPPHSPGAEAPLQEDVPPLLRLVGHQGPIYRLRWYEAGKMLASASDDRSLRLWSMHPLTSRAAAAATTALPCIVQESERVLWGHAARLWDCQVAVNNRFLVTASEDCTLRFWKLPDGTPLSTLKAHRGRGIWCCCMLPDAAVLASGGADASLKLHSMEQHVPADLLSGLLPQPQQLPLRVAPWRSAELQCVPAPGGLVANAADGKSARPVLAGKAEWIRALALAEGMRLYVGTNQGYIHGVALPDACRSGGSCAAAAERWCLLGRTPAGAPVTCISTLRHADVPEAAASSGLLHRSLLRHGSSAAGVDAVLVGDIKGCATCLFVSWQLGDSKGRSSGSGPSASVDEEAAADVLARASWTAQPHGAAALMAFLPADLGGMAAFLGGVDSSVQLWSLPCSDSADAPARCAAQARSPYSARICCVDFCRSRGLLVCGDIVGNLTAFQVSEDALAPLRGAPLVGDSAPLPCVAAIGQLHADTPVGLVLMTETDIVTAGRDSCVNHLHFDTASAADAAAELAAHGVGRPRAATPLRCWASDRFSAITAVELDRTTRGRRIVAGFQAADFVVWAADAEKELARIACGGWRRPRALHLSNSDGAATFAYVQDRRIAVARCPAAGERLAPLHHGREIHTCVCLPDPSAAESVVMISGGEDGMLRAARFSPPRWAAESAAIGEHAAGTAIRCIAVCSCAPHDAQYWMVSAGAKQVLMLWQLSLDQGPVRSASRLPRATCRHVSTRAPPARGLRPRSNAPGRPSARSDQRFMAAAVFPASSCCAWGGRAGCAEATDSGVFLAASSSDAALDVLWCDAHTRLWLPAAALDFHTAPVLCLAHHHWAMEPDDEHARRRRSCGQLLCSGSTDGTVAIWDLGPLLQAGPPSKGADAAAQLRLQPSASLPGLHMAGVNAMAIAAPPPPPPRAGGRSERPASAVLLTAGDDQRLCVVGIDIAASASPAGAVCQARIHAATLQIIDLAHASALKGVWTDGVVAFSTALDQRLHAWHLRYPQPPGIPGEPGPLGRVASAAAAAQERTAPVQTAMRMQVTAADAVQLVLADGAVLEVLEPADVAGCAVGECGYVVSVCGRGTQVFCFQR